MRPLGVLLAALLAAILGRPSVREALRPSAKPAAEAPAQVTETHAGVPLLVPVQGIAVNQLRDNFAQPRGKGRTHHALDILAPAGTPVVAAVDGKIRKLFTGGAGGITIYQFDEKEELVYYYAHLDRYADDLKEGAFVKQGTVIGYVGTTGNAPKDTPHLHFAIEQLTKEKVWWKGTPLNPYSLLTTPASMLP